MARFSPQPDFLCVPVPIPLNKRKRMPSNEADNVPASPDPGTPSQPDIASEGEGEIPDADLVVLAQAGDTGAFETLVTRYRGKVYAMIYNMIHNDADAWDLAQDTFLKAWKALPRFEARSAFYTWIYRITHNVAYDWLRKKKITTGAAAFDDGIRRQDIDPASRTTPQSAAAPDRDLENSELGGRIKDAIAQLSPGAPGRDPLERSGGTEVPGNR